MKTKTINYGKVNDATVYAVGDMDGLTPLDKKDLEFTTPNYRINFDSGAYPVSNLEQHICNQVVADGLDNII